MSFRGRRFPKVGILTALQGCLAYPLSYRPGADVLSLESFTSAAATLCTIEMFHMRRNGQ